MTEDSGVSCGLPVECWLVSASPLV